MAYRTSGPPDLPRPERWDRDRVEYESERERDRDRDRYSEVRERFEEDDDHVYVRRGPPSRAPPPPWERERERERDRDDRSVGPPPLDRDRDRDRERRFRGDDDEHLVIRERRRVVYDDDGPEPPLRRRASPPPSEFWRRPVSPPPPAAAPPPAAEVERSRVVIEKKERYRSPSPEPARRPAARLLRRQSSLDTFDRKPAKRYWESQREEHGPPARRDEHRVPHYVDIPLPRAKALPPPRVYAEREYFDEIQVSDPHRYGDEDFHAHPPERVREREVVRTRRRTRSRDSRAASRRGRSRSSSSSSSSSDTGGTTLTVKSEYPKKGKTRVPARLVSKRALIELGYPYVEEGNVIIVQMALGQKNIDDLLKLSDDYKKSELEIVTARSSAGDIIEERIEHRTEIYEGAAALPPPAPTAQVITSGGNGPVIIEANPPHHQHHHHPVDVVKTTVVRDVSPTRYTTSSYDTYDTYTNGAPTIVHDSRSREVSGHVPVGPVALASHHHHHQHRDRHDAYETDDLRSEIRHLEKQIARRERSRHGGHSRHRSRSLSRGGELVRAERLSTGELVLYEEEVELVQEPTRGGPRLERDKRGRMSISVPRFR
ncbi:hypothetical protein C8A01DRAFT_36956 [Parachaetomium inaequale]|uniref:DUF8035 domain-containing protein n=1 Tax=Parachaetomium inaequale TaxID=2588326 RepID=A0AAN6PEB7_9PEZI|nr:hypothetical protein C8A01DRAFT_36956 [Parachaetomium inaequale]